MLPQGDVSVGVQGGAYNWLIRSPRKNEADTDTFKIAFKQERYFAMQALNDIASNKVTGFRSEVVELGNMLFAHSLETAVESANLFLKNKHISLVKSSLINLDKEAPARIELKLNLIKMALDEAAVRPLIDLVRTREPRPSWSPSRIIVSAQEVRICMQPPYDAPVLQQNA